MFNIKKQAASVKLLAGFIFTMIPVSCLHAQRNSLIHDNLKRTYNLYIPTSCTKSGLYPLVIVLHGGGGNGKGMVRLTQGGFNYLADTDGFIVVYPDGIDKGWNDGRKDGEFNDGAHRENVDDVGFISALIDKLVCDHNADPSRIYVTGISNGAMMSFRLACELTRKIAAVAPVAGSIPATMEPDCSPSGHLSVLIINGTDDPLVPYGGGEVGGKYQRIHRGKVLSVDESVKFWVDHDHCSAIPAVTKAPDRDPYDRTRTTISRYANNTDGTEVVLYSIMGGGHTWPGGWQYLPSWLVGKTCHDFDADEVIWEFFEKHTR
jgi:polyhydroxybutyrate depolymerase